MYITTKNKEGYYDLTFPNLSKYVLLILHHNTAKYKLLKIRKFEYVSYLTFKINSKNIKKIQEIII